MLEITDVTLRDGLQGEAVIPAEKKRVLFHRLVACKFSRLEITSFVPLKWVPQFSDTDAFLKLVEKDLSKVSTMAFVPNVLGLERLLRFDIPWVSTFIAASEAFNKKNVNRSIDETLGELKTLVTRATQEKRKIRIYVSTLFGCPYEGVVKDDRVVQLMKQLASLEPNEIALSDTLGVATPSQVRRVLSRVIPEFPIEKLALHFHDTYGLALANVTVATDMGITKFDGSMGGTGGCPFAKGATGNLASEELLYLSHRDRGDPFLNGEVLSVLTELKAMGLKLHSRLWDILERGGSLYGV